MQQKNDKIIAILLRLKPNGRNRGVYNFGDYIFFAIILVSIVTVYSWIDGEKKLAAVNFVLVIVLSILTIVCFAKTQEEKVKEEIVKENLNQGGIRMKQFNLE